MRMLIIGDRHDVVGFGLAGVDAVACHSRLELIAALDAAHDNPDLAVVIVSPEAAALAPDLIARLRESPRLPITVVLPECRADAQKGSRAA